VKIWGSAVVPNGAYTRFPRSATTFYIRQHPPELWRDGYRQHPAQVHRFIHPEGWADLTFRTIIPPITIMIGDKKVVTSSGRKILR
jgi:hypothetical protein